MAENLPKDINENLEAPSEALGISEKRFWKEKLTNNDFVRVYRRKGVANRTINKQVSLMFKKGFSVNDPELENLYYNMDFQKYLKYAYLNSLVSGFSLIYKQYDDELDYEDEVPSGAVPVGFFVVTRAWVYEDKYYNQEVRDYYIIQKADGTTIRVHESRIMRVQFNQDGVSLIEKAYDSLMVLDNTLWGMGQTMFRSGSGFPVLLVNPTQKHK